MYIQRSLRFCHAILKVQKEGCDIHCQSLSVTSILNVLPPEELYTVRGGLLVINVKPGLVSEIAVIVKHHAWLLEYGKMNSHIIILSHLDV